MGHRRGARARGRAARPRARGAGGRRRDHGRLARRPRPPEPARRDALRRRARARARADGRRPGGPRRARASRARGRRRGRRHRAARAQRLPRRASSTSAPTPTPPCLARGARVRRPRRARPARPHGARRRPAHAAGDGGRLVRGRGGARGQGGAHRPVRALRGGVHGRARRGAHRGPRGGGLPAWWQGSSAHTVVWSSRARPSRARACPRCSGRCRPIGSAARRSGRLAVVLDLEVEDSPSAIARAGRRAPSPACRTLFVTSSVATSSASPSSRSAMSRPASRAARPDLLGLARPIATDSANAAPELWVPTPPVAEASSRRNVGEYSPNPYPRL